MVGNGFIWDEWISSTVIGPISGESELSGIIASLKYKKLDDLKVRLSSNRLWVFRRMGRLWSKTRWAESIDLGDMLKVPARHRGSVSIVLDEKLYLSIREFVESDSFMRWPWVRGVFGVIGSLYVPKRGYYFSFRSKDMAIIDGLEDHLFKNNISFARRSRGESIELIVRDRQDIMDLMTGMVMPESASKLEEKSLVRSVRDSANRLVNCDASNIKKSLIAARSQLSIATFLKEQGLLADLSDELYDLVYLRMDNPSANLSELAASLTVPVSKSTVKYRWKKLKNIAEINGFVDNSR